MLLVVVLLLQGLHAKVVSRLEAQLQAAMNSRQVLQQRFAADQVGCAVQVLGTKTQNLPVMFPTGGIRTEIWRGVVTTVGTDGGRGEGKPSDVAFQGACSKRCWAAGCQVFVCRGYQWHSLRTLHHHCTPHQQMQPAP
jgi:hypothetical protein